MGPVAGGTTPCHRALTALPFQIGGAADALALDGGATRLDLVTSIALDQRNLQPLARSERMGSEIWAAGSPC
jgi:hypothetical protein